MNGVALPAVLPEIVHRTNRQSHGTPDSNGGPPAAGTGVAPGAEAFDRRFAQQLRLPADVHLMTVCARHSGM